MSPLRSVIQAKGGETVRCCFLQVCANFPFNAWKVFILIKPLEKKQQEMMTQKTASLLFTPDLISPVHTSPFFYSSPNFRPVAACRWHNPGNQKLRALQRKKETWGKSFSKGSERGRLLPFLGTLAPMQAQPKPQRLLRFHSAFLPRFSKRRKKVRGAERKKHPFSKQTIHTRSGRKRAAAVRLVWMIWAC